MNFLLVIICFTECVSGLLCSEDVTKREGETVVLSVNGSYTLTNYLWTHGPDAPTKALAVVTNKLLTSINGTRFDSRLGFDISSGSMTISNLTIGDSGRFLMQIFTETGTVESHFNLAVTGNLVIINVLEGSNVTIKSELAQLDPTIHHVFWTEDDFSGKQIATWENNIVTYDPDMRDYLQLDPQTGSLTIISISKQHAGHYCIRIMYHKDVYIMNKYRVHVYRAVSTPHLSTEMRSMSPASQSCRVNCSVLNSDDLVLILSRGETVLNQSSSTNMSTPLTLTLDVPLSSREETFTCVAENPISKQTTSFNATNWCPQPAEAFTWKQNIVVPCVLSVLIISVAAIAIAWKTTKKPMTVLT